MWSVKSICQAVLDREQRQSQRLNQYHYIYILKSEVLIWGFIEIHFFMLQLFYRAKIWLSCFLIFWYQISHVLINCITFIAGSCFSNDHISCLFFILRTAIWECLWENVVDVYIIFWYLSCNKKKSRWLWIATTPQSCCTKYDVHLWSLESLSLVF